MSSLQDRLSKAKRIVFFTGAGVSAESGIPTFRGQGGIWNKLKPEELANFNAFMRNTELVWEWYNHRKTIVHESQPNGAHKTISDVQKSFPEVIVITQNVDNLHNRAGSKTVYELHGNIIRNYCIKCKRHYDNELPLEDKVPRCECGGLIRPDVVWFGEMLPQDQFMAAEKAAEEADIFFVVGTTGVVQPAASLIYVAKESGAYMVEVNIERTDISYMVHESYFGEAGKILPEIFKDYLN